MEDEEEGEPLGGNILILSPFYLFIGCSAPTTDNPIVQILLALFDWGL